MSDLVERVKLAARLIRATLPNRASGDQGLNVVLLEDEVVHRIEELEPFKALSVALQKQVNELEARIDELLPLGPPQ